jgi:hypothetical protein
VAAAEATKVVRPMDSRKKAANQALPRPEAATTAHANRGRNRGRRRNRASIWPSPPAAENRAHRLRALADRTRTLRSGRPVRAAARRRGAEARRGATSDRVRSGRSSLLPLLHRCNASISPSAASSSRSSTSSNPCSPP